MDLTTLTDEDLDALRVDVLTEQERRTTAASAPARITEVIHGAKQAGVTEQVINAAVTAGLTPEQAAALTAED